MVTLAIDTSEARGSVALLRGRDTQACRIHSDRSEYSAWLLPAVDELLVDAGVKLKDVDLLAVSSGPGSFTGLRVGLTTVKALAEVYRKPVVGVSRLLAMARLARDRNPLLAACYDAQRGQLFGAGYSAGDAGLQPVIDEVVIATEEFVQLIDSQAGTRPVTWISLDPQMIEKQECLQHRLSNGDRLVQCSSELASSIGLLAQESAARGEFANPVELDANYVRRSDAEIFWKGTSAGVR